MVRKKIARMKRFDIGPVFRPGAVPGSHPREVTECALDIITAPPNATTATGEVGLTLSSSDDS